MECFFFFFFHLGTKMECFFFNVAFFRDQNVEFFRSQINFFNIILIDTSVFTVPTMHSVC